MIRDDHLLVVAELLRKEQLALSSSAYRGHVAAVEHAQSIAVAVDGRLRLPVSAQLVTQGREGLGDDGLIVQLATQPDDPLDALEAVLVSATQPPVAGAGQACQPQSLWVSGLLGEAERKLHVR